MTRSVNHSSATILIALACALSSLTGCGGTVAEAQKLLQPLPVKGIVMFKGKPLSGGTIRFEPVDGGREASGNIGKDGTFTMATFQADDGAVAGTHRIAIGTEGLKKGAIPLRYQSPASSGIELEVTADKIEYVVELK